MTIVRVKEGWLGHLSPNKKTAMCYATVQGVESLTEKFRNSSVMLEAPRCRPRLFYTWQDVYPYPEQWSFCQSPSKKMNTQSCLTPSEALRRRVLDYCREGPKGNARGQALSALGQSDSLRPLTTTSPALATPPASISWTKRTLDAPCGILTISPRTSGSLWPCTGSTGSSSPDKPRQCLE
ncbi:putative meiosis protein mei2 protein [Neofusicoccum parvum]|uniref:Meiosis protein mei2 protein n=1 Tax=Neofusicoccum parvum TaxID=310453 RepID=A0ACB5SEI5_9PEZI|nr:putative meiosis protein mei2 protein [Neofusicoccum parvum]